MHYIIQEDVFRESNYKNLVSTIHKLGLPYTIVRIFPFIDKIVDVKNIPDFSYDVDRLPDINVSTENVFCFGAIKLARVASKFSWYPGSLLNSNHDFNVYKNHYDLLNRDSIIQKFGDSITWDFEYKFFRPTEDTKSFVGKVYNRNDWEEFVNYSLNNGHETSLNSETLIQVSSVKNIQKEIRFWVVGGKVITGSQYRLGNKTICDSFYDTEAFDFAQDQVDKFQISDAFVIDVCLSDNDWKVVEVGCINSAGFYNCDIQKLIISIDEYFNI